jgi:hypothetical protein
VGKSKKGKRKKKKEEKADLIDKLVLIFMLG